MIAETHEKSSAKRITGMNIPGLAYTAIRTLVAVIIILHLSFFLVTAFFVIRLNHPDPAIANPETTSLMSYRSNQQKFIQRKPRFIPLREIPADIISSIIFIEDFHFFSHSGIDFDSIRFAIKINKKLGYMAYGGSTLTQQLGRTFFLNPSKNYVRKYLEILIALEMELFLSKERILELYLNYAEWGKNIYGIYDASVFYYEKSPADLSDEQKLSLLTLLANPRNYTPDTFKKNRMLSARYKALAFLFTLIKTGSPCFKSRIREAD
jgi:monofunctional biosynthetic peptidoglycan transglycosylase